MCLNKMETLCKNDGFIRSLKTLSYMYIQGRQNGQNTIQILVHNYDIER